MMRRMLASSSVVALVVQRADLRFLVRPEGFEPPIRGLEVAGTIPRPSSACIASYR
jgi:hypothetical protein